MGDFIEIFVALFEAAEAKLPASGKGSSHDYAKGENGAQMRDGSDSDDDMRQSLGLPPSPKKRSAAEDALSVDSKQEPAFRGTELDTAGASGGFDSKELRVETGGPPSKETDRET